MIRVLWVIGLALAACDAGAWSPAADRERRLERRAAELSAHLAALPGIARASVVLDAPAPDPLAPPAPAAPPRASVVLALAPGADPAAAEAAARRALAGAVAGLDDAHVTVVVAAAPAGDALAAVGPFRVAASSRTPLIVALAAGLVVIAALAAWIAAWGWRQRRGTRPQ